MVPHPHPPHGPRRVSATAFAAQGSLAARLLLPLLIFVLLFLAGSVGYYILGHLTLDRDISFRACVYQTAILITSVGFTDILETHDTWAETLYTILLAFLGVGAVLYIMATVTAFVVGGELTHYLERRAMEKRIASLDNHYIVCGGGRTGRHVVEEMIQTRRPYVLIECDPDVIDTLRRDIDEPLLSLQDDGSDDEALLLAGIERAAGVVTALPSDKDNLLAVITARQLNPKLRIISRCVDLENARKLRKAGADSVVSPNMIGGLRMASELLRPTVVSFLDTMLRDRRQIRFEEIRIPEGHALVGQSLAQANLPAMADINIIAARRPGEQDFLYNPRGNLGLIAGMDLVAIGAPDEIAKLRKHLQLV